MLLEEEKKWITENIKNGSRIIDSQDKEKIILFLHEFTVDELYDNDFEATEKTHMAESIIDRLVISE